MKSLSLSLSHIIVRVHFMIEILSYKFNSVHTTTSFKILNDVEVYTPLDL